MNIRKRYSEFDDFRHHLVQAFPSFEAAVPALPPKSVIAKFRPNFLEKRRAGLQYFLKYVSPPSPPKQKKEEKKDQRAHHVPCTIIYLKRVKTRG